MKYVHLVLLFSSLFFSSASVLAKAPIDRNLTGVFMSTKFPAPNVYIDMMPVIIDPTIGNISTTPSVEVIMILTNKTSQPISYTFPSSKTFDIYIKNQYGEVISSWSKGMFFSQVITNLTILPGDSYTFGGKVELTTINNAFIDPGDYVLSIELENSISKSTATLSTVPSPVSGNPASQMPLRIDWVF